MAPLLHHPPRLRFPLTPPAASCRPCLGAQSWRESADCPRDWTPDHIYRTGTASLLRQQNKDVVVNWRWKIRVLLDGYRCGGKQRLGCSTGEPSLSHFSLKKKSLVTNSVFTCVNDDVLRQVSHINKCLVTHLTLVRADVVVMANVIGQLTRLHKPAQKHIYDISSHLLYWHIYSFCSQENNILNSILISNLVNLSTLTIIWMNYNKSLLLDLWEWPQIYIIFNSHYRLHRSKPLNYT